jgi:RNA polymerase sigma-70 factor (ECF subfamily)
MGDLKKKFSKIYDQYINKIYRFIFLKVNSREIAQDLTSETFLRAWKAFQKIGNPESKIRNPPAFLYRVARNLVTDYYRQKARVQIVSAEDNKIIDPRIDLEEKAVLDSDFESIKRALNGLNEDYQNVLIWRYIDDLSISEIANLLDRTEGATRVLIHRALNVLRQKLNTD